jgi:transcriptional regulator with XRE-family HTH domain
VDIGIGATLREARNRRKIDLSQVEARTRIRARYLRAIESENWEVLPGEVYTRSFIRTYASYLGLDGERLADEYKRHSFQTGEGAAPYEPLAHAARSQGRRRLPRRALGALVTLGVLGLLVALGLSDGGSDSPPTSAPADRSNGPVEGRPPTNVPVAQPEISLRLAATAEVWVCLLDAGGRPLVNGQILTPGAEAGPFRSGSFTVAFGNGEVSMTIDGKEADIPATSSPVGYAIDRDGTLSALAEGERPTCT